jgi:hypothetical protein
MHEILIALGYVASPAIVARAPQQEIDAEA